MSEDAGDRRRRPFESHFAIVVAAMAATSCFAGFMSSTTATEAAKARIVGLVEQNEASAHYNEANLLLQRDVDLLKEASVHDFAGETDLAEFTRMLTGAYLKGYITASGNGTELFGGDFLVAMDAYIADLYAPYETHQDASDDAFELAEQKSTEAGRFLLSSVLFAVSIALASVGMTVKSPNVRLLVLASIIVVGAFSWVFVAYALIV